MPRGCVSAYPGVAGWGTSVGRSSSIYPNRRILIENPMARFTGQKNLTKREFGEFTSTERYAQLLFIKYSWQSKNFDKPSYNNHNNNCNNNNTHTHTHTHIHAHINIHIYIHTHKYIYIYHALAGSDKRSSLPTTKDL